MKKMSGSALVLFTAILALAGFGRAGAETNWLDPGFDGKVSGFNGHETILSPSNVGNLQTTWTSNTSNINGVSSMVEENGTIFVESEANSVDNVTALSASDGSQLWSSAITNWGYNTGIAAGAGRVFSPCEINGNGQQQGICAFNQKTGMLEWSYVNSCNCDPPSVVATPPIVSGSTVYFAYQYGGTGESGLVVAADARTGAVLWTFGGGGDGWSFLNGASPAVADGMVYLICFGPENFAGLCAFDATTGAQAWTYAPTGGTGAGDVSVSGDVVYYQYNSSSCSNCQVIVALNAATGATLWSFDTTNSGQGDYYPPAIAKGKIYWVSGGGTLYALKAKTGAELWSASGSCGFVSSPSVANGVVYLNLGNYCIWNEALNAETGAPLWSAPNGSAGFGAPPMIVDGTLYAECWEVCAYNVADRPRRSTQLAEKPETEADEH